MLKIIVNHTTVRDEKLIPIETYSRSFIRELRNIGHEVLEVGEGNSYKNLDVLGKYLTKQYDLYLDLDCGRNKEGNLSFQPPNEWQKKTIKSAIKFIDSHGYPSLHKRLAKNYDHVFFAVWDRRDLFAKHSSSHWCPNASDIKWFNSDVNDISFEDAEHIIGFFGSKGGLNRAAVLKLICKRNGYDYDVREIGKQFKHRWPRTAEAMLNCKLLFNKGQKHDSPNQRVIESMLVNRPLITNLDPRDGMGKLFTDGIHYLGWASEMCLEDRIKWCLKNPDEAKKIAENGYKEAKEKHQIKNRVQQILEVCK